MSSSVTCDQCKQPFIGTRQDAKAEHWFVIETKDELDKSVDYDICSWPCLGALAMDKAVAEELSFG